MSAVDFQIQELEFQRIPTGLKRITPLKRAVSCSSVHGSAKSVASSTGGFDEVGWTGVLTGGALSVEGVEGPRDGSRCFFFGGMRTIGGLP